VDKELTVIPQTNNIINKTKIIALSWSEEDGEGLFTRTRIGQLGIDNRKTIRHMADVVAEDGHLPHHRLYTPAVVSSARLDNPRSD